LDSIMVTRFITETCKDPASGNAGLHLDYREIPE